MLKCATPEAYQLLHQGSLALAEVEAAGIRIDTQYLDSAIEKTANSIKELSEKLRADKIYSVWRKEFGERTRLGSREQLARILFDVLKYPCKALTRTGRYKTDINALETVDIEFVKSYLRFEKLKKAKSTYLEGIKVEVIDGFLHPSFNLHTVRTFRSSSSAPNFQNMPVRSGEFAELIRRAFIPRDGNYLVEVDYSAVEVRLAAAYHKDPTMLAYINNPASDMHKDMAQEIYCISPKEWGEIDSKDAKQVRYCAKNMYVFPVFYGSYYIDCSRNLWEAINRLKLKGPGGISLKKHLAKKGIKSLGECDPGQKPRPNTFEAHVAKVEKDFWTRRFPVYAQWKDKWYKKYLSEGGFTTLTGFRENGLYKRNDVINHPVQGSAFHCLLWSLIQMVKYIKKHKLRARIVGQIHDSLVADVPKEEIQEYLSVLKSIMTEKIRQHWKWLIIPLDIEAELSSENWFLKKQWIEKDGIWAPKG